MRGPAMSAALADGARSGRSAWLRPQRIGHRNCHGLLKDGILCPFRLRFVSSMVVAAYPEFLVTASTPVEGARVEFASSLRVSHVPRIMSVPDVTHPDAQRHIFADDFGFAETFVCTGINKTFH
jgi:hypothetical protein